MCSVCHRDGNPEYPEAPKGMECGDCHAERPRDYFYLGGPIDLGLDLRLPGCTAEEGALARSVMQTHLVEQEITAVPPHEAEWDAVCTFALSEVQGGNLIPAGSGVRLFRGTVEVRLGLGDHGTFDASIVSRVHSARDPAAARREILAWLAREAFRWMGLTIEEST